MRRQVALLAAISAAAPAALLAVALAPVLFPRSGPPSRAPIYIAVGAFMTVSAARAFLLHRLTPADRSVIRFWGFAPTLTLLVASALGALPVLALGALDVHVGRAAIVALGVSLAVASSLVVWALWRRLRASLGQDDPRVAS
jgi:hypothetical protein